MIRQTIMFWIVVPVLITIVFVTFIEITGRFFRGDVFGNAAGIIFLSGLVPIFAAHVAFLSAIFGVIGLFFGLQLDRKFLMSLLVGLAFGAFMLHRIYLS
jgi:hypothetical protein